MTRVSSGTTRKARHKKILKMTKGHQGVRNRLYKSAKESLLHALSYSYAHRRKKKNDLRRLWNIKINAAARANGLSYNQFIYGLKISKINVNRKMLASLAISDPDAFNIFIDKAKTALKV
ncbi:MAG: 50S ribosomal protein L20 [Chloroflexi bacterium]|nr:50S ribosomal protein L20 [Chloroflexota bacterium]